MLISGFCFVVFHFIFHFIYLFIFKYLYLLTIYQFTILYLRLNEGRNVLFNDTQHILFSYMVSDKVKDHSEYERRNLLPPVHGLLFPISSKGSFI